MESAKTSARASMVNLGTGLRQEKQGALGVHGTACNTQSAFSVPQTWSAEQWLQLRASDSVCQSKSPSQKSTGLELNGQRPPMVSKRPPPRVSVSSGTDFPDEKESVSPPVFVSNFSANKFHLQQVAQLSDA